MRILRASVVLSKQTLALASNSGIRWCARCPLAKSSTSTWTRFMRPWSSATIRNCAANLLLSRGEGIAPWCVLLRMKHVPYNLFL